ncbi:MAG: hypothetical protein BroJett025_02360 [Patescibacteria group bacterium]|nr:MAG: hypothetical protein BroJett025_02360 [Patescibacteria group bacterium]
MQKQTQLTPKRKEVEGSVVTGRQTLSELPKIKEVISQVPEVKFGRINQLAQDLANEIYHQLRYSGLYSAVGQGSFRVAGKNEEIIIGSPVHQMIQEFFALSRLLASHQMAPRGTVLLNTMCIYLGLALVNDQSLVRNESRKRLLLETLNLYQMPVGLYSPRGEMAHPEAVQPAVLFDMQEIEKQLLVFRRKTGKVKVDVIAYNALVNRLSLLLKTHKKDRVIQDWCEHKLKELEVFAQSLAAKMQIMELNKRSLYRWQK